MAVAIAAAVSAPRAAAHRIGWLDAAKGLGIVLVVFGHAVIGLVDAGLLAEDGAVATANFVVYTFHMPLFFFLSGLLVEGRVTSEPAAFARSLPTRIAYPYFLWGSIQLLVIFALGDLTNRPHEFSDVGERLVANIWNPPSQFWFLYVLFFLHLIAMAFVLLGRPLWLLLFATIACLGGAGLELDGPIGLMAKFGVYHALGVCADGVLVDRRPRLERPALWAIGAGILCVAAALAVREAGLSYWSPSAIPAAVFGSAALILLSQTEPLSRSRLLGYLGQRSLTIMVLHVLCVAGARIVLVSGAGITDPRILLPLAVAVGLAGPVLAYEAARRLGLRAALGLS